MFKNLLGFLNPYKLWIYGGLILAAFLYVSYLNIRIDWLKSSNEALEVNNKLWRDSVKELTIEVKKQNKAVDDLLKLATKQALEAQDALKKAQAANTIRQGKINAATARIELKNPVSCDSAIESAKKEL
jgi:hypothetical protein